MVEIPEEEINEMAECPTCGSEISFDAAFCPECGQEFEAEEDVEETQETPSEDFEEFPEEDIEEPLDDFPEEAEYDSPVEEYQEPEEPWGEDQYVAPAVEVVDPMEEALGDEEKPYKLFWTGVILILLGFYGGPVFSYLHDALEIPVGPFKNYASFGWVNWTVAIIGSIMTAIGVVLLIIGWFKIRKWRDRVEALLEEPEEAAETLE